jgi:DNA-binding winged helix-turn-helix (wHTH) protein
MASHAGQPPALELDLKRYEVRLRGAPLRLERRPMELLILLLEHPGELVTREAIQRRLWRDDVFVDVDQGINTAINKIRQALKEDPSQPTFLQTVIGKGYRFVGPVTRVDDAAPMSAPSAPLFTECALVWEGRSIPLAEGVNVIGRDSAATLVVDSSTVSRKHAQIVVSGSVATIEDLGSKNRTQVNGQREEGCLRLADYDVIQIAPATIIFRLSSPTGSTLTAGVRAPAHPERSFRSKLNTDSARS